MKGLGRLLCKGTLERSLFGWLDRRCSCWRAIKWSSVRGNGWFENWSRCVHISREDRPGEWIQKFKAEVATVRGVEKWLRLKAPDGEVPTPTPGLLSQLQGSCWDFWPGQAQL